MNMDKDTENALWEELKILQQIIDKFDTFSFQITICFLTIFVAVTSYAFVNNDTILPWINFAIIVLFYIYEIAYRIKHVDFLERSREIQEWLREKDVKDDIKTPYLDKFLDQNIFLNLTKIFDKNLLYIIQKNIHMEEIRSKRNVLEWKMLLNEAKCSLFQSRVSFPYIAAVLINVIVLIILNIRLIIQILSDL
jgi:hypothetical protein